MLAHPIAAQNDEIVEDFLSGVGKWHLSQGIDKCM